MPIDYDKFINYKPVEDTSGFGGTSLSDSILDNLPDVLKRGYNDSIAGMADQLITGQKRFNLKNYDTSVLEDIGAQIASLVIDTPAIILGGGVGGLALKTAGKQATKTALKSMAKHGLSKTGRKAVIKGVQRGVTGAGALGTHSGISSALSQKIEKGEIEFGEVGKSAAKGATLGAVTGGIGGAMTAKGFSGLSRLGAEVGSFGTLSPALEGRMPEPQDYVHAAGMILGLKAVHGGAKLGKRAIKGEPLVKVKKPFEEVTLNEGESVEFAEKVVKGKGIDPNRKWYTSDKKAAFPEVKRLKQFKDPETKMDVVEVENVKTGARTELPAEDFYAKYHTKAGLTPTEIRNKRLAYTSILEKNLGISAEVKSNMLKNLQNVTSRADLSAKNLAKYAEQLRGQTSSKRLAKNLEGKPMLARSAPASGLVEDFIPKKWQRFILDPLKKAESRIFSKPERVLSAKLSKYQNDFDIKMGEWVNELGNLKMPNGKLFHSIFGISRSPKGAVKALLGKEHKGANTLEAERLYEKIKKGEWKEFNELTDKIYKEAKAAGLRVAPYRKNYVTQMLRDDIRDLVMNDLANLEKSRPGILDKIVQSNPEEFKRLEAVFRRKSGGKTFFSKETIKVIDHIRANEGISTGEAFKKILNSDIGTLYKKSGFLEEPRRLSFPPEFYERDVRVIAQRYITETARRIVGAKEFGARGEKAEALMSLARKEGSDSRVIEPIYRNMTNTDYIDPAKNYSPAVKRLFENLMALNVGFKISTGFATIPNLTQPIISSIAEHGITPFVKGVKNLASKDFRNAVRDSGATNYNLVTELLGYTGTRGRLQNLAKFMSFASGFKTINKINQFTAAATAQAAATKYYKLSKGAGKKAKVAQARLERMGVDYKKALEPQMATAMRKFAINSQLQRNVLRDPLMMSDPKMRPFMLFKSFGLRQYQYAKDMLKFELGQRNLMPIIRLTALGYLGGAFVHKARHWLKELLAGEDIYRRDADGMEAFVDYVAQVGAFGMLGDWIAAENKVQSAGFFITPVIASDAIVAFKSLNNLVKDQNTYGMVGALRRQPKFLAPIFGTFGRSVVQAENPFSIQPKGQRERSVSVKKGRVRSRVLEYLYRGKSEIAMKNVRGWNKAHPENPITYNDINGTAVYEYILDKNKRKLNP